MTVTETARDFLRNEIQTEYTLMDIGEGGGSTDITNNSLDISITDATSTSKLTCVVTNSTDNQVEYEATVSGTTYAGYIIREVGIFNAAGSTMLTRIPIDPIGPLVSSKTYDIKIILEVE